MIAYTSLTYLVIQYYYSKRNANTYSTMASDFTLKLLENSIKLMVYLKIYHLNIFID